MTHAEHSKLVGNATPCTAANLTFGGKCIACGWTDRPPRELQFTKEHTRTRIQKALDDTIDAYRRAIRLCDIDVMAAREPWGRFGLRTSCRLCVATGYAVFDATACISRCPLSQGESSGCVEETFEKLLGILDRLYTEEDLSNDPALRSAVTAEHLEAFTKRLAHIIKVSREAGFTIPEEV